MRNEWVDYNNPESNCDKSSQVGLCCDVSNFCPPRSVWNPDPPDNAHQGQMFMQQMSPEQMSPEMVYNCKCDAGFFMVASSVYSGRCQACPKGSCSRPGSTSIDQCFCLEGFYKDANGDCTACPANSCSNVSSTGLGDCKCFEGFYMSGAECAECPEGKTTPVRPYVATSGSCWSSPSDLCVEGDATSEAECTETCGLPHSSTAGANADAVGLAAADVAAADVAQKKAMVPFIQAVKDETAAQALLDRANAFVPPSPPTWASITTTQYSTGLTDRGDGGVHYLERQNVDCGANPLTQLRMSVHNVLTKIRYDFKCAGHAKFGVFCVLLFDYDVCGRGCVARCGCLCAVCVVWCAPRTPVQGRNAGMSYEEEDTCMSYKEEDTCILGAG